MQEHPQKNSNESKAARVSLFVLLSLFNRPQAGLATVLGSFFGFATNTPNARNISQKQKQDDEKKGEENVYIEPM